MKLYYWNVKRNFGDLVGAYMLEYYTGKAPVWAPPSECDIVSCGSTLDVIPQIGWAGLVVGSGKLFEATATDLTSATVLGVRGPLTLNNLKMNNVERSNIVLGDPALLASELVPANRWQYGIGVAPHWTDTELYPEWAALCESWGWDPPLHINVAGDPVTVMSQIGSVKKLVTSSLHATIVADSFGIPRRVEHYAAQGTSKYENLFKWNDYAALIGQPITYGVIQEAPVETIEQIKADLFGMFQEVKPHVVE